jgi:DNA invertase Pin-like site-specific DNA recombinase
MYIDTASAPGCAKRAAFYVRVTPFDPNPEPQLLELRKAAAERGYEVVAEFTDRVSGTQAKRPALDRSMADARRGQFDLLIVCSCDRIGRSTRQFLDLLDELRVLHIDFCAVREGINTSGPLGSAIVLLTGVLVGLERSLTSERVRAGMRRARLDGQLIGRKPLDLDILGIHMDRHNGKSLQRIAKDHRISTATVQRVLKKHPAEPLDETV